MKTDLIQALTTTDHFVDVNKMVDLGSGSQREAAPKTPIERSVRHESLPAAEDIKKVERRLASDEKKAMKKPDALDS